MCVSNEECKSFNGNRTCIGGICSANITCASHAAAINKKCFGVNCSSNAECLDRTCGGKNKDVSTFAIPLGSKPL
jgi:hypothetical protein